MKKREYSKKGLMPVTVYLPRRTVRILAKTADDNARSRKSQAEKVLTDWANMQDGTTETIEVK